MLEKILQWHSEDKHQQIVDFIEALADEERLYEVESAYGRALNNLNREDEALGVLERIQPQGEHDPVWHWRIGYSLYYLDDREAEAAEHFQKAIDMGYDNEQIRSLLQQAKAYAARKMEAFEHYKLKWDNRTLPTKGAEPFEGFDFVDFWETSEYAQKTYTSKPATDGLVAEVEAELGYKLPDSYLYLVKKYNGGIPKKSAFRSERATSWAQDHVQITGLLGIGADTEYSIQESCSTAEDWGYPKIGVPLCDCPSAGHDMIFLDYTYCGQDGEPAVVHIDQEDNYTITYLADHFEAFIRGLYIPEDVDEPFLNYDPTKVVTGSAFLAFDAERLLKDMYQDAYFPDFLVDKVRALLCELVSFIDQGTCTYAQVQEKLDEITRAINALQDEFAENNSDIETVARESIAESVELILMHFDITIDIEQAIREREW